jgi:hypothetical protein
MLVQCFPISTKSCPTNSTAPQCETGSGECKGTVKFWLWINARVSGRARKGWFSSPQESQEDTSAAKQPANPRNRICVADYKKDIFKSWRVFRGLKVRLQKPQKHHELTMKKTTKHHQGTPTFLKNPCKNAIPRWLKKLGREKMVEAVGVEPTSEKTSNREHSCFFRFIFVSSSTLRTDEDAPTTSLISLI